MPGLVVTSSPATEPITLTEAKLFAKVDTAADDALITALIKAAREYAEPILDRTFVTTTYAWTLDGFPSDSALRFPRPPLLSVVDVTYIDSAGDSQTWASGDYDVDTASLVGRLLPAYGQVYPATRAQMNAVTVNFTAGDGAYAGQREDVKLLMKILVTESYLKRRYADDRRVVVNELAGSLFVALQIPSA